MFQKSIIQNTNTKYLAITMTTLDTVSPFEAARLGHQIFLLLSKSIQIWKYWKNEFPAKNSKQKSNRPAHRSAKVQVSFNQDRYPSTQLRILHEKRRTGRHLPEIPGLVPKNKANLVREKLAGIEIAAKQKLRPNSWAKETAHKQPIYGPTVRA